MFEREQRQEGSVRTLHKAEQTCGLRLRPKPGRQVFVSHTFAQICNIFYHRITFKMHQNYFAYKKRKVLKEAKLFIMSFTCLLVSWDGFWLIIGSMTRSPLSKQSCPGTNQHINSSGGYGRVESMKTEPNMSLLFEAEAKSSGSGLYLYVHVICTAVDPNTVCQCMCGQWRAGGGGRRTGRHQDKDERLANVWSFFFFCCSSSVCPLWYTQKYFKEPCRCKEKALLQQNKQAFSCLGFCWQMGREH